MYYYKITSLIQVNGVSMADDVPFKSRSKNHDTLKKKVKDFYAERAKVTPLTFVEVLSIEESTINGRYITL